MYLTFLFINFKKYGKIERIKNHVKSNIPVRPKTIIQLKKKNLGTLNLWIRRHACLIMLQEKQFFQLSLFVLITEAGISKLSCVCFNSDSLSSVFYFIFHIIWFKIEFLFVCNKEEVSVEVLKTYIQVSFQKYCLFSLM